MPVEHERCISAAEVTVYPVRIADRYCGNYGTFRRDFSAAAIPYRAVLRAKGLDLQYLAFE